MTESSLDDVSASKRPPLELRHRLFPPEDWSFLGGGLAFSRRRIALFSPDDRPSFETEGWGPSEEKVTRMEAVLSTVREFVSGALLATLTLWSRRKHSVRLSFSTGLFASVEVE